MANGLVWRVAVAASGFALAGLPGAPASAQFMTGPYPVIVVPPPPAQGSVIQKRPRQPTPQPAPSSAPPVTPELRCRYQGQTRVCE